MSLHSLPGPLLISFKLILGERCSSPDIHVVLGRATILFNLSPSPSTRSLLPVLHILRMLRAVGIHRKGVLILHQVDDVRRFDEDRVDSERPTRSPSLLRGARVDYKLRAYRVRVRSRALRTSRDSVVLRRLCEVGRTTVRGRPGIGSS
jgi:hypothetical protein